MPIRWKNIYLNMLYEKIAFVKLLDILMQGVPLQNLKWEPFYAK